MAVQLNLVGSHDAPRLRTVLGDDVTGVRLATLLQMTLPGAPCIYYGDEIGLRGGNDPENRGAFPWDEGRWETGLRDSVRAMTHLRATEPALRDGPLRVVGAGGSAVAFERGAGAARFVVAVNAGDSHDRPRPPVRRRAGRRRRPPRAGGAWPASTRIAEAPIVDGRATVRLGPRSGGVLRVV